MPPSLVHPPLHPQAKALAKQCVVFNCSDGLDYLAMAKFFKGVAAAGAWACFDEFNRIDLEVLSVIAQQCRTLSEAKIACVKDFMFEGSRIALRPSCHIVVTMNPGYAGRSELPDSLKVFFRPCAMMLPDYSLISEIKLRADGFVDALDHARKLVQLARIASELLSSQDHYDYGMRNIGSVCMACGKYRRASPHEDETSVVLQAVLSVNEARLVGADVQIYKGIVRDLFPGIQLAAIDYAALRNASLAVCQRNALQLTDSFFVKLTQLYELLRVRHGLMLVGQPFGAKSSVYRVLAGAMGELGGGVEYRVLHPKVVDMGQLYGQFEPVTHEWTDGLLATSFRELARPMASTESDPSPDSWLVLDGPVDAIWIENMNTVLDDNKKLCLMSGTRPPLRLQLRPVSSDRVRDMACDPDSRGQVRSSQWLRGWPSSLRQATLPSPPPPPSPAWGSSTSRRVGSVGSLCSPRG